MAVGDAVGDFEARPWGSWKVLDVGDGFKIKEILVNPHSRLSYQTHDHRSEHWVVISGVATCVIDGETVVLTAGHSTDVAVRQPHRITNAHDELLHIVEIQRGDNCSEDDIVRLEDDYDRVAV